LGSNALRSSSTAFGTSTSSASTALNVAIGNQSMRDMEQGWVNVAIGSTAMLNTKKGDGNIAIGAGTMEDPSFGVNNIALGTDAIHQGENMNSVAIGNQALFNVTNVPDQSNFEQDPDVSNLQEFIARTDNPSTTLDESMYGLPGNIAIGAGAFASPQASTATITEVSMENIAIGHMSMNRVTKQTGGNIAIGSHSLPVMEDGGGIISIGQWSLNQFKEGWGNTILGNGGAQNLEKGSQLTLIGQGVAANAKNIRSATAVGVDAMGFAGKASQNTAFGRLALMSVGRTLEMSGWIENENGDSPTTWVVSGTSNVAIGPYSLMDTDSGYENVSIGRSAMISNIGGAQNVAVGDRALRRNNSDFNTGVGRHALETNVEGEFNTALGYFAGSLQNAQGDNANDYNTYLGALTNTVSGSTVQNSTAIGYEALVTTSNTIQLGNDNIELVSTSGVISATGFVGDGSRLTNVDFVVDFDMAGIHNTVIGNGAMSNASGGSYNIAVGKNSMSNNTSGSTNAAFGQNSLESNTTGGDNLALGYNALNNNTTGSRNVVIGKGAASNNDSGNNNVAIGGDALVENFNGNSNIAIGTEALRYNSEGNQNVAIGQGSLSANLVSGNIGIGFNSLTSTVSGSHNVAIGEESMISNVSGFKNVAIGASSMRSAGGSNYQNTSVGHDSSQFINGHNNTAIGFGSGRNIDDSNSTSNNNTFLGKWTGATAETGVLQNSTVIGSDAEVSSDHTMVFGDQDVSKWAFGLTTTDVGKAIQVGSDTTNGNGAYLTTGGTWTNGSSILFKTNFINLSNDWILDKISKLNIRKWDYKNTNETHIGPTSEEFIELFDVGINNENSHISTIDVSGVALKGVQALINENEIQKEQLKNQSDLINELYDRIIALEKKINE
ncbi:MAG: hypothetical protein L7S72_02140, partial [Flavobacteriales bacterium]|nr:hypothetical protein [Flavobacteriales bacterium]